MSDGIRMSYVFARGLAFRMLELLCSDCERIEIAGSLRRKKETVGDIEIVLIPKPESDLFGGEIYGAGRIEAALIRDGFVLAKNGNHFKQAHLPAIASKETVNFDIFLTTPECWGVIFTIRTGSADFSRRLVTPRQQGGLLPSHLKVREGRIWNGDTALDTPEEADVFKAIGLEWIEPSKRVY
jgi:DNA polymerase/3'-5' exonuclease PolX